jgi:drug/metabolite transporter (DMT)-like permease
MLAEALSTDTVCQFLRDFTNVTTGNQRKSVPVSSTITTMPNEHRSLEIALLLLLATLWGASYTFIKIGVETIPPLTLIAGRTLIAGTLLLLVMRMRGVGLPGDAVNLRRYFFQACLNSVVPFTLIAWAERAIDAGLATVLNSTSPIFAFLITLCLVRHEPATRQRLFGVVSGLLGICLIVGVGALDSLGREMIAQLAIIAATICYGGAAIFGRSFAGLNPIVPATGSMLCGAAVLVPASIAIDRPWTLSPSIASLLALAGLAVIASALAFVIYFRLVRTLGSIGVTAQSYLRVPIGVAIGVLFLDERVATTAWIGLVFIVLGVAAMTLPNTPWAREAKASA